MAKWQKCEEPKDCGQWLTPPAAQGQIVLRSYSGGGESGLIYRRTWDQSSGKRDFAKRLLCHEESFEPWQIEPE